MAVTRRLLTVGHSYVVRLNRRLAHELARAGGGDWDVTAVAPTVFKGQRDLRAVTFEPAPDEPCRVVPVPARFTHRVHVFLYGRALRRLLRDERWDVVHAWEEPFILAGHQIARWTPKAAALCFATFQNIPKRYPPPFNWLERRAMSRASGWVAFGQTVHDALRDRPPYRDRPVRVIPPGVDTDIFRPDRAAGDTVRRALGWPPDGPPVVGYLGRFLPEKGIELLTTAIDQVTTPWRALFVGAGPMESHLRAFAARHGDDRVRVVTGVAHDAVPAHLNAMDLLCAPSQTTPRWREQFGRMLIEAFACGLPVLGSDSGEIPHVIGDAGAVLPEADVAAWAAAIGQLVDSPDRRADLSARGRDRARDHFAWPAVARQHLAFFDELCQQRRPS